MALPFFSIGVLCFWGALEVIESLWAILFFFGFVPPPYPPSRVSQRACWVGFGGWVFLLLVGYLGVVSVWDTVLCCVGSCFYGSGFVVAVHADLYWSVDDEGVAVMPSAQAAFFGLVVVGA